jgi:hypothetical protein
MAEMRLLETLLTPIQKTLAGALVLAVIWETLSSRRLFQPTGALSMSFRANLKSS